MSPGGQKADSGAVGAPSQRNTASMSHRRTSPVSEAEEEVEASEIEQAASAKTETSSVQTIHNARKILENACAGKELT